jgi:hypothetical protein
MNRILTSVSDSPFTTLVIGVLLLVSLVLGGVALARAASVDDVEAELAATQSEVAGLQSQVDDMGQGITQILGLAFQLQSSLSSLGPEVRAELDAATAELAAFRESTLAFAVDINERIPIETNIPLQRTLQVPIDTSIPINETVNTTIVVDGPFGLDIPVGVTVPIDLEFPVQLDVPIPIDETVSVSTEVVVDLSVPIAFDVADTDLILLVDGLQSMVDAVTEVVDQLGSLESLGS